VSEWYFKATCCLGAWEPPRPKGAATVVRTRSSQQMLRCYTCCIAGYLLAAYQSRFLRKGAGRQWLLQHSKGPVGKQLGESLQQVYHLNICWLDQAWGVTQALLQAHLSFGSFSSTQA